MKQLEFNFGNEFDKASKEDILKWIEEEIIPLLEDVTT